MNDYFIVDSFKGLRTRRQKENDRRCAESLFTECTNLEAKTRLYKRLVEDYPDRFVNDSDIENYMSKNDLCRQISGMQLSVNASRQGSKDEAYVITGLKESLESKLPDFSMDNLKTNEKVPILVNGHVLSRKEAKKLYGKTDMLKSFDFEGKVKSRNFYGFAKILVGSGGHQDNVWHEARSLIEWVDNHNKVDSIYILLLDFEDIDTTSLNDLKKKNHLENVYVCNHIEFQDLMERLHEQ
jgi:hypothetical protein